MEPGGDVRRGVGAHAQEPGRGQADQPGVAGQDHQPDGGDGGEQDEIDVAEPVLVERERQDDGKGAEQGQPGVLGPGVPEGEVPAVGGVVDAGGGGHASDPLDPDLAEEAVGLHQQDGDEGGEGQDHRPAHREVELRVLDQQADDALAVLTERGTEDRAGVLQRGAERLAGVARPELRRPVLAPGQDRLAVRAKNRRANRPGVLKRPADRPYAETRGTDPDGNNFDLTTNGFDEMRPDARVTEFGKE